MKRILILLLLISTLASSMPPQMEMGQACQAPEERSTLQACCHCALDLNFSACTVVQGKTLGYLTNKAWESIQQPDQTALRPMIYASGIVINGALLAGTAWYHFRKSKFKEKED